MTGTLRAPGRPLCILLALLAAASPACGGGSSPSQSGDIVIGLVTVTTGLAGDISAIATRGAQVALHDADARGGLPQGRHLRLEVCDNGSPTGLTDPQKTIACAARFLREHVGAVAVTDEGSLALVTAQLTANKVLTVGAYGDTRFDDPGRLPYVFSLAVDNGRGAGLTVNYMRAKHYRRVADLHDTSAPAAALSGTVDGALRKAGIDVVDEESFGLADLDVSAQVSRVVAARPDLVFVNTYGLVAARVMRDLLAQAPTLPVLGSALFANTPVPLLLGGAEIPTLRLTTFTSASVPRGATYPAPLRHLVDGLAADGKGPLTTGGTIFLAMYGYDIVSLYANAYRAAGTTEPDSLRSALEHIHLTRASGDVYTQDIRYSPGHHAPDCDAGSIDFSYGTVPDANGVLVEADPSQGPCS